MEEERNEIQIIFFVYILHIFSLFFYVFLSHSLLFFRRFTATILLEEPIQCRGVKESTGKRIFLFVRRCLYKGESVDEKMKCGWRCRGGRVQQ